MEQVNAESYKSITKNFNDLLAKNLIETKPLDGSIAFFKVGNICTHVGIAFNGKIIELNKKYGIRVSNIKDNEGVFFGKIS